MAKGARVERVERVQAGAAARDGWLASEGFVFTPLTVRIARWGIGAWSLLGILLLAYLVMRFVLVPIDIVFPPLLLALILVYLLNPIVTALQRRGLGRPWGTFLTYMALLSVIVLVVRFLGPPIGRQVTAFAQAVPGLLDSLQGTAQRLNDRFNLNLDVRQAVESLGPAGGGGKFISRIFSVTVGVLHVVATVLIGLLSAFYLLVDLPKLKRGFDSALPPRRRDEIHRVLDDMSGVLGGYFRGQLAVATFVGVASAVGLFVVGLPYWALVGGVSGLFNLIPLIGPFIAGALALFIAFTTPASEGLLHLQPGLPLAVGAGVALLTVQQIDNHIITPNVIGRTVALHPVTVMLGLLAAGSLLGLVGMLLAVPVIGSVKVVVLHAYRKRRPAGPVGDGDSVLEQEAGSEPGQVPV